MDILSYKLGKKAGGGGGSSIDWTQIGYAKEPESIQEGFDYAKQIYDNWDATQTSLNNKFKNDEDLIYMPLVDTSNNTSLEWAFSNCSALCKLPLIDTSNVTTFYYTFNNCGALREIPNIDTSSATTIESIFNNCYGLKKIPNLNTSNVTNMTRAFQCCSSLTSVPELDAGKVNSIGSLFTQANNVTNLGGFKDLGKAYLTTRAEGYSNYRLDLSPCTLLTHDSLMNVINNLYDIGSTGVQRQQVVLGATNLAKLTAEEIAIGTDKGWIIS